MKPTIPEELKDLPKVILGGFEWAVAPMSARKIIKFGSLAMNMNVSDQTESTITSVFTCCWIGISSAHKDVSLDQFLDDYHVTYNEAMEAFPVLATAAGMDFVKKGEAQADQSLDSNLSTAGTS